MDAAGCDQRSPLEACARSASRHASAVREASWQSLGTVLSARLVEDDPPVVGQYFDHLTASPWWKAAQRELSMNLQKIDEHKRYLNS